jgi:cell division protein FtsW
MKVKTKKTAEIDYLLLYVFILLVSVGLVMIFSASPLVGLENFNDSFYYIKRHLVYLLIGAGVFLFAFRYPIEKYRPKVGMMFVVTVALLLATYLPVIGITAGGASRWINLGIFSFQPSEIAKITMLFFVAHALRNKSYVIKDFWKGVFPILMIVGVIELLILKQPDLGTALTIALVTMVLVYVAGGALWQLLILGLLAMRILFWMVMRTSYQKNRILAFIDPWKDPLGVGFHIIQSLLAVGSGGILGVGLGQSRQKFSFLPQQFTDFVFAILCEEGGLVLATFVILLFLVLLFRGLRIGLNHPDPFAKLVAIGFTSQLVLQGFMNMMVATAVLPTTGIPLPFISYGGTSLVVSMFMIGTLLQLSKGVTK